jgi:hypothetical protein
VAKIMRCRVREGPRTGAGCGEEQALGRVVQQAELWGPGGRAGSLAQRATRALLKGC